MGAADVFGWMGIACLLASCILLKLSRNAIEEATAKTTPLSITAKKPSLFCTTPKSKPQAAKPSVGSNSQMRDGRSTGIWRGDG